MYKLPNAALADGSIREIEHMTSENRALIVILYVRATTGSLTRFNKI